MKALGVTATRKEATDEAQGVTPARKRVFEEEK